MDFASVHKTARLVLQELEARLLAADPERQQLTVVEDLRLREVLAQSRIDDPDKHTTLALVTSQDEVLRDPRVLLAAAPGRHILYKSFPADDAPAEDNYTAIVAKTPAAWVYLLFWADPAFAAGEPQTFVRLAYASRFDDFFNHCLDETARSLLGSHPVDE